MSRNFTTDQVLIDRLLLDDTDAFEELYRRYWYALYVYSVKKLHSPDDAKCIVRDLFIELWKERKSWPVSFSVSQHLYDSVRKAVVKSLSLALSNSNNTEIIGEKILPGFSIQALQQARQPVTMK
jgi:hypothetical protein